MFPRATVHAIEPDPVTFAAMAEACRTEPRIVPANVALADRSGTLPFHRGHFDATSSLFPRSRSGRRYFRSDYAMAETINVAADTLDAFREARGIKHIDVLKLDTQGGEHAILTGAARTLSEQRIDLILTEFFVVPHYEDAPLLDAIWALLRGYGYVLHDLDIAARGEDGQARYGDAIFFGSAFRARREAALPPEP